MKPIPKITLIACLLLILFPKSNFAWGFYAHQQINRLAVFCLPQEMFGFYKTHIDFISEHAVDPDKRRYLVEGEGVKHFIDIDYYEKALPFDTIPRLYHDAVIKFSKDTLHTYGIVPWNIQWMLKSLTQAFLDKNKANILKYSAEIGHYIGDAHVPLHATSNYNGQQTNQHGIHGFFESRLPELFSNQYDFFLGQANYIAKPNDAAWEAVEGSFACLDSVFWFERYLHENYLDQAKYVMEWKGSTLQKMYSKEFSEAYHLKLQGMVERRMQAATICIASFWFTAWVNAGQPNLLELNASVPLDSSLLEKFPTILPTTIIGRPEY